MIRIWYGILAFVFTTYVILDGRNFGAGALQWIVAKTAAERQQVSAVLGTDLVLGRSLAGRLGRRIAHSLSTVPGDGVLRLLSGPFSGALVADPARHFTRSGGSHHQSTLAGLLGLRFQPVQYFAGSSLWHGDRESGSERITGSSPVSCK